MPKGYYPRSLETNAKISAALKGRVSPLRGRHHSAETRAKMSQAQSGEKHSMYGKHPSFETRIKMGRARLGEKNPNYGKHISPMVGKHHTEETKEKIRQAKIGKHHTLEAKAKMSEGRKGRIFTPETKAKISQSKILAYQNPEYKDRHTKATLAGKTEETYKKMSRNKKLAYLNPEFKNKMVRAMMKGRHIRPTKPEIVLGRIIDTLYPNTFKYNGDYSLGVTFDGLIPDFWNINGQKKVIELFGDYWHSETITKKAKEVEELKKIERYQKCGVDCLIIWEKELKQIGNVISKIQSFCSSNKS